MSLIQPKQKSPAYANMIGGINSAGNVLIASINFATSFLSSNGITKINDYTVRVSESGLYELICPISIGVATRSGSWNSYIEVGKNFSFSTYSQNLVSANVSMGLYSIIVFLDKNDDFSLRSQIVGTITGHTTRCNLYDNSGNVNGGLTFPTLTMKRI